MIGRVEPAPLHTWFCSTMFRIWTAVLTPAAWLAVQCAALTAMALEREKRGRRAGVSLRNDRRVVVNHLHPPTERFDRTLHVQRAQQRAALAQSDYALCRANATEGEVMHNSNGPIKGRNKRAGENEQAGVTNSSPL